MKKFAAVLMKFFTLLAASALAALFLCLLTTFFQRPDAEKIAAVQQELDRVQHRIESINERIALWERQISKINSSPLTVRARYYFAIPAWKAKIIEYRTVTLPALELQKVELQLSLNGFDETLSDKFALICRQKFLIFFVSVLLLLIFYPPLVSLLIYFIFARYAEKFHPVYLPDPPRFERCFSITPALPMQTIQISGEEHYYLRPGWCRAGNSVATATKFMWKWSSPLISAASGLIELADISAEGGNCGEFTVTPPVNDLMISEITLDGTGSVILRPRHLIGVTGDIKVRSIWNFSIHNILSGKLRQVQFYGTGRILIAGAWGISEKSVTGHPYMIDDRMIIALSGDSGYTICRAGSWWHYFRKKSPLFNVRVLFGKVILQNHLWDYRRPDATLLEKIVNLSLNGIGSFLGL